MGYFYPRKPHRDRGAHSNQSLTDVINRSSGAFEIQTLQAFELPSFNNSICYSVNLHSRHLQGRFAR